MRYSPSSSYTDLLASELLYAAHHHIRYFASPQERDGSAHPDLVVGRRGGATRLSTTLLPFPPLPHPSEVTCTCTLINVFLNPSVLAAFKLFLRSLFSGVFFTLNF